MKPALSRDQLADAYDYNPENGLFFRKHRTHNWSHEAGTVSGSRHCKGYVEISVDGRRYLAHRLAWLYVHGVLPDVYVDHINGDKSDNRISNLRLATNSQNLHNTGPSKRNSSGVRGVHWCKTKRKWKAEISVDWKRRSLGYHDDIASASAAYARASSALTGEFCAVDVDEKGFR